MLESLDFLLLYSLLYNNQTLQVLCNLNHISSILAWYFLLQAKKFYRLLSRSDETFAYCLKIRALQSRSKRRFLRWISCSSLEIWSFILGVLHRYTSIVGSFHDLIVEALVVWYFLSLQTLQIFSISSRSNSKFLTFLFLDQCFSNLRQLIAWRSSLLTSVDHLHQDQSK